jgi:NADH-quinone oxidoreductase subunit C
VASPIFGRVAERLAPAALSISEARGVLALTLAPSDLTDIVRQLKADFGFDLFLDVTAVDWPCEQRRFELVYHFYSTLHRVRVRLKTRVTEADPVVDSLVPQYASAGFMERECHDMYGIVFHGNPDLRPILLYEGFVGHPLRKDYPKEQEQPLVPYRSA